MRYLAATLLAWSSLAAAAPPVWLPDPTFGTGGATTLEIEPGANDTDRARLLVTDTQKRLYLIGNAFNDDGGCLALARFLPDGELDSATYGEGGKRCLGSLFEGGGRLIPTDALVLADGTLVIAGFDIDSYWPVVCGFDTSGQLDTAHFGSTSTPGCAVFDDVTVTILSPFGVPNEAPMKRVSIAADTDILRIAISAVPSDKVSVHLARLTLGGHIVPFGQSSTLPVLASVDHFVSDIALADDGMLVIAGAIHQNFWDFFVAVLDPDSGEKDNAFNGGEILVLDAMDANDDAPSSLALSSEGNIVIGGASDKNGTNFRPTVAVVTRQGQFLPSFHNGQPATYNPCVFYFGDCEIYVTDVEALPDGKLLLGGYALQDGFHRAYTMRLQSDGTSDASYGPNFPGQQGYAALAHDQAQVATSMLLQDGQTVLAGWRDVGAPNGKDFFVTRLSDGSLFRDGFDEVP